LDFSTNIERAPMAEIKNNEETHMLLRPWVNRNPNIL
jgi:hypothetical protein